MGQRIGQDQTGHLDGLPRCPVCGAVLDVQLLDLEDEDRNKPETLLLLDCPQGHIQATLTREDVVTMMTAEVRRRLRLIP